MLGGTVMQTIILIWITVRTDWHKEVKLFNFSSACNHPVRGRQQFSETLFGYKNVYYKVILIITWKRLVQVGNQVQM